MSLTDREQIRRDAEEMGDSPESFRLHGFAGDVLALLAELEQAERERDEAREDVARCAADTTAADLAQEIEFLKAETERWKEQRWSFQNRAEVAERGHKAALARCTEQRKTIKSLRRDLERSSEGRLSPKTEVATPVEARGSLPSVLVDVSTELDATRARAEHAEAQLAKVPALVEALRHIRDLPSEHDLLFNAEAKALAYIAREALAACEAAKEQR